MKSKIVGEPTPTEVVQAISVIAEYLRRGGWCEAIIGNKGGAYFRLSSAGENLTPVAADLSTSG